MIDIGLAYIRLRMLFWIWFIDALLQPDEFLYTCALLKAISSTAPFVRRKSEFPTSTFLLIHHLQVRFKGRCLIKSGHPPAWIPHNNWHSNELREHSLWTSHGLGAFQQRRRGQAGHRRRLVLVALQLCLEEAFGGLGKVRQVSQPNNIMFTPRVN